LEEDPNWDMHLYLGIAYSDGWSKVEFMGLEGAPLVQDPFHPFSH
jgi:hypothetical protein